MQDTSHGGDGGRNLNLSLPRLRGPDHGISLEFSSPLPMGFRLHTKCRLTQEKMACPVAVECAEDAVRLDHLPQGCHHRPRRFLLHQLRVVDLIGGVVHDRDQIMPAVVLKPADARSHPDAAACPATAAGGDACGAHRAYAPSPPPRLLAVPASPTCSSARSGAPRPASRESAARSDRSALPGTTPGLSPPSRQARAADWAYLAAGHRARHSHIVVIAMLPPPHLPVADPEDLGRLPPGDLLGHRAQDHFLHFHPPLLDGRTVVVHVASDMNPYHA